MGRAKLVDTEKARAIAMIEQGVPVTQIAADLKISRQAIYNLIKAARSLPKGAISRRRQGTGGKRKTPRRTDALLKCEVLANPMFTAASLKKKHPELLEKVSIRTIQHRLQKDLGLPCRRAAKKPLLTANMKKKRLQFCNKYKSWTSTDWRNVMFSNESTFRLIRGQSRLVRRPRGVSRYDARFTVKTVKHADSVMV